MILSGSLIIGAIASLHIAFTTCFVRGPEALRRPAAQLIAGRGEGGGRQRTSVTVDAAIETPVRVDPTAVEEKQPKRIEAADAWSLIEDDKVSQAVILSWKGHELLLELRDGEAVTTAADDVDIESFRDSFVVRGIPCRYPAADRLSEEDALKKAALGSESAVASGVFAAAAIGLMDVVVDIAAPLALSGGSLNAEIGVQSFLEGKTTQEVIVEDTNMLGKDLSIASFSLSQLSQWFQDVWAGLFTNHAPGLGGVIEDSFMGLLVAVSLFSLYQMAFLKRKANSLSGFAHTATGAMQIVAVLYPIVLERCFREAPGPIWAVFSFAVFMINNITMWPLLKYFRGTEVQRVLFKLAYSFIISFQGIHAIAWSIQYPWLYWVVMPFWFYSVKKLAESSDNILALLPDNTIPIEGVQEGARRRVRGIKQDTPTIVYSALNFGGAVFDNLYMAVYTWRGPAGFWGYSMANIPAVNDHLRTGLVKPSFGSLTISVLVFLATLVYRKKIDQQLAVVLNVILASVGPWLILYYHKLVDWDEPWQPEIMGEWESNPYFSSHFSDLFNLPALIAGGAAASTSSPQVADKAADAFAVAAPLLADAADAALK